MARKAFGIFGILTVALSAAFVLNASADDSSDTRCRDSVDSSCGSARWDHDPPPNDQMSITIRGPSSVRAGDVAEFIVHVEDDAHIEPVFNRAVDYGDGTVEPGKGFHMGCRARYGTWTTPGRAASTVDAVFRHAYDRPGIYKVTVSYFSWTKTICDVENDPFADRGLSTVNVEVTS